MQVILGTGAGATDVTSAVQESTYEVDRVKKYIAWKSANNIEVHENVHYKVEGTFDMVFMEDYSMDYDDFLSALTSATTGDVVKMQVTVNNMDEALTTIDCFLDIKFSPIKDPKNGSGYKVKRCTCTIKEC